MISLARFVQSQRTDTQDCKYPLLARTIGSLRTNSTKLNFWTNSYRGASIPLVVLSKGVMPASRAFIGEECSVGSGGAHPYPKEPQQRLEVPKSMWLTT